MGMIVPDKRTSIRQSEWYRGSFAFVSGIYYAGSESFFIAPAENERKNV